MIDRYTYSPGQRFQIVRGQTAPVQRVDGLVELRWGMTPPWRGHGDLAGGAPRSGVWRSHPVAPLGTRDDRSCVAPLVETSLF